ncbi:MAG TPA: hypothetical protein VFB34_10520 [Chloroflexota bacterium]|nr:hypothetical protein [Chloroflexota bacterium]
MAEKVLWTVLPNGIEVDRGQTYLKVTVAVSPRCYGTGTALSSYPSFVHWPNKLAAANFKLQFNGTGGPKQVTAIPDPKSPSADPTKWGYLFDGSTSVTPYSLPDLSKRFIIKDPQTAIYKYVKPLYQSIISGSPDQLPRVLPEDVTGAVGLLYTLVGANFPGFPSLRELDIELKKLENGRLRYLPSPGNGTDAMTQLQLYFNPDIRLENGKMVSGYKRPDPWPTTNPELDFHEQVGSLGKFAELQRHLGLAIDLLVPLISGIPKTGTTTVQLVEPVLLGGSADICPQTHYRLTSSDFLSASNSGRFKERMLDITNPATFNLVQIDTNTAGLTMIGLIKQLMSSQEFLYGRQARTGNVERMGLPTLRSGGLAVLQSDHDSELSHALMKAVSNNTTAESGGGSSLDLYAEDINRGYRLDIWDSATRSWHSLHQRGPAFEPNPAHTLPPQKFPWSYKFTRAPSGNQYFSPTTLDEGYVSLSAVQDPNAPTSGGTTPELYLAEVICRWMGWSLAAGRPNMFLSTEQGLPSLLTCTGISGPTATYTGAGNAPAVGTIVTFTVPSGSTAKPPSNGPFTVQQVIGNKISLAPTPSGYSGISSANPLQLSWQGPPEGRDTPAQFGDDPNDGQPGPGVHLVTHFGPVDGSLPRLRFGRGYRLRVRSVDLAGNSLQPSSDLSAYQVPPASEPALIYRRFEPVLPPNVVPHDDLTTYDATTSQIVGSSPGESNYRLVIRSNYATSQDDELAYLRGTGAGQLGYVHLPPETTRWIVPPRIAQIVAEHQELFDNGAGWRSDALDLMTNYDSSFGTETLPDGTTVPVAHGGTSLGLPYLPDTLAAGTTFQGIPGYAGTDFGPVGTMGGTDSLSFPGIWPDFQPFRLTVRGIGAGATQAPHWDAAQRILTVFVPKGGTATSQVSSFLTTDGLELLGIWGWIEEYATAGKITSSQLAHLNQLALLGLMWALTPTEELTFVHAVQQPLVSPAFPAVHGQTTLRAVRDTLGQTDALLLANPMPIDGLSTTKVDIYASWTDPRDDLSLDPCPQPNTTDGHGHLVPGLPKEIPHTQHVLELPLQPDDSEIKFNTSTNYRHKFGDTKHHEVTYMAEATTRFLEYFPSNDPRIQITRPDQNVPSEIKRAMATVNVLSTARPLTPNILYAVPAFGWETIQGSNKVISGRTGGFVRVYLDRPFYSSGTDELLGVVLINNSNQVDIAAERSSRVSRALAARGLKRFEASGVTTVLEKYVTQWGMDPLWSSPGIQNPPMASNFPSAARTNSIPLYLDELGGSAGGIPVSVAGFPVTYDPDRCLYFSDLHFDWGDSYFPFVRLALAAYQPNSIAKPDTVHLSRVVMTDFVQLAPNRIAEVITHSTSDPRFVKVAVAGVVGQPGSSSPPPGTGGTVMELTLEQQAPGIMASSGELSWVPVPNADYTLIASKPGNTDITVWSTSFDLPHPAGSVPYRLIVREYELYAAKWKPFTAAPSGPPPRRDGGTVQQFDKRLVYAATLQI